MIIDNGHRKMERGEGVRGAEASRDFLAPETGLIPME
jgi:hypothetical protein